MFELEHYDLDDEVFLNTQMPTDITKTATSSGSNDYVSNFENDDESFFSIPDPVLESEILLSRDEIQKNALAEDRNLNKSNTDNNISSEIHKTEGKSEKTIPATNGCQTNRTKLNFDDGFDSDDEAFFYAPDVLDDSTNSSKLNRFFAESDFKTDPNKSVSRFSSESHIPIINSSESKSSCKSNFNSVLNTTVTSVKTITPKCTSRKFPGPAGLLSENENSYSDDPTDLESLDMSIIISENEKKDENLCAQANDSSFTSLPYQQFLSDFFSTDVDMLLNKYNVTWIKQKILPYTASGRFYTDKIPFFVSVIKEIDCLSPDPTVVLADKTGNVRGTIHREVWNQFSSQLKLGAVLVLSKVGVSCQKIVKGFTLNITSDHLVAIYSLSSEDVEEVIVTRTTDLSNEEIVNNAKQWNVFNTNTINTNPHSEVKSRMVALNNLKLQNSLSHQCSQQSNINHQTLNLTPVRLSPVNSFFKPKTPVAHILLKNDSCDLIEEPPIKRLRNEENKLKTEENKLKTEEKYSNNEVSIIANIFEGINEEEMFSDFCC